MRDAVEALWEAEKFVRDHPKEASDIDAKAIKADPAIVEASIKWLSFDPLFDDFTISSLEDDIRLSGVGKDHQSRRRSQCIDGACTACRGRAEEKARRLAQINAVRDVASNGIPDA